jgi:hypothetical protein
LRTFDERLVHVFVRVSVKERLPVIRVGHAIAPISPLASISPFRGYSPRVIAETSPGRMRARARPDSPYTSAACGDVVFPSAGRLTLFSAGRKRVWNYGTVSACGNSLDTSGHWR